MSFDIVHSSLQGENVPLLEPKVDLDPFLSPPELPAEFSLRMIIYGWSLQLSDAVVRCIYISQISKHAVKWSFFHLLDNELSLDGRGIL